MIIKFTHKEIHSEVILDTTNSETTKNIKVTGDNILVSIFDDELNRQLNPGALEFIPKELKPYIDENGRLMKYKDEYIKNIFIPTYIDLYEIEILKE